MGTAILQGLLDKQPSNEGPKVTYSAYVRSEDSMQRLRKALGQHADKVDTTCEDITNVAREADVVILGVPPDQLYPLLKNDGLVDALRNKSIVSLLAGISCSAILYALSGSKSQDQASQKYHITRIVPTMGAEKADSVTLFASSPPAGQEQLQVCRWLCDQLGSIVDVEERAMNAAQGAGAATNALTFLAVDAIVDASVAEGLARPAALQLAAQSIRSAASLLSSGYTPESMKASMSLPGAITINALLQLEREGVRSGISGGIRHAIKYTNDMS